MIGSFNCFHADHVVAAFKASKDVYCEKPLATALDDCLRMRDDWARHQHGVQRDAQAGAMDRLGRDEEGRSAFEGWRGKLSTNRALHPFTDDKDILDEAQQTGTVVDLRPMLERAGVL